MRLPIGITIIAALIGFFGVVVVGQALIQPALPLIIRADFDDALITPNADGEGDITTFRYALSRHATISIYFEAADGTRYDFRRDELRIPRDYSVLFSGVVGGYVRPGEAIPGTVERRLIPDGTYDWVMIAENQTEREEKRGTLTLQDADSPLPIMTTFTVAPDEFTPNQDGVNDRVEVNVYLEKDADLRVFLLTANGVEIPISARKEGSREDEAGRHIFDYAGGVDLGADPPPDGTYTVVAVAQDAEGQRVRREADLTIMQGGKPRAEISPQAVDTDVFYTVQPYAEAYASAFETSGELLALPDFPDDINVSMLTIPLGDMLAFRLTVENYSDVPIRTTGPAPGTVYQQTQVASSLGAYEEPGAWRVGIQCDTSSQPFPYRWAIGADDVLMTIEDPETGKLYRYLPPQTQTVVWGAIRMTDIIERQNPQTCWAGLIHEQVGITVQNNNVDPREIQLVDPLGIDS